MSTPTTAHTTTAHTTSSDPRTTDVAALREPSASGRVRVLDVRTPAELETLHIPGAHTVPLDTCREHRWELERQERPVTGSMVLATSPTTAPAGS